MKDKDLRRLSRADLIDIIYHLQESEEQLRQENETMSKALADREIKIASLGSVAEAALSLNHVFEAAQAAADQYLAEAKRRADRYVDIVQHKADVWLKNISAENKAAGGDLK